MLFPIDPNTGGTVFIPPSYLPPTGPGEGASENKKTNYTAWLIGGALFIAVGLVVIRLTRKK